MDKTALQQIAYGMYVVTSPKGDRLNGQISNTVFQVTAEPPQVAVAINKLNLTHEFIQASRVFAATVLCQETPLSFIGHFGFKSGRETNKLEGIKYKIGQTGAPIVLDNAVSVMEVRVTKEVDVGTHTIFIGEVVDAEMVSQKVSMTYSYYHEIKRGTLPKTAPHYVEEKKEA
jgi:flavin reductase (DIM6/NTAB) family NADH-FMN oxidoreductase RutF